MRTSSKTTTKKPLKRWIWSSKCSSMASKRSSRRITFFFFVLTFVSLVSFATFVAPLPPLFSPHSLHNRSTTKPVNEKKFEIALDKLWKDGQPFRIIGGDLHYFRVLPELWDDRLLRAKALGLNAIQTYVPWNLHEPVPGTFSFDGIADLVSFLRRCQKHGLLVMLRPGPYICGEWDLGGFPPWLLAIEPALRLRSSDPAYLQLVDKWWGVLLPKIVPLLYENAGPIIMVQIENEYGSFGTDKAYLRHLARVAKDHLGDDVILYTTDGGTRETLDKGTIQGDSVFSAVDFSTGENPRPIFQLQKKYNFPGRSPPLSAEFYTGWLTHWQENMAHTGAEFTASALEEILAINASVVLYMAHGGTNFGFYNGANTGANESDYKPDLTSYDYDAPISETGDINNAKFKALRRVIARYTSEPLPSMPPDNEKIGYGVVRLRKTGNLLDMLDSFEVVKSEKPQAMETVGQMFGFLLYVTKYAAEDVDNGRILSIPKVHDRAQVLISCSEHNNGRPVHVGTIERWSGQRLGLPSTKCVSRISLFILVENMGRLNYGPYIFDRKGIISPVYLNGKVLKNWNMYKIPLANLNEIPRTNPIRQASDSGFIDTSSRKKLKEKFVCNITKEPAFYTGRFNIEKDQIRDTFLSLKGWGKGVALVNGFNVGRFWPSIGPQCNLYVPAPILKPGENVVEIFELENPNPKLFIRFVDHPNFTCGSRNRKTLP